MKLMTLYEAPTLDDEISKEEEARKKAAEAGVEEVIDGDKGSIENALDRAYRTAKRQYKLEPAHREWPAILFVGEPGTGKTARIKAWARANRINLYAVQASTMEEVDLNGPVVMDTDDQGRKFATRLASIEFDKLTKPNSVLFLDEFNRARGTVRGTLLTLINDHMIPDAREEGGMRYLENMLFTVAAINPDETSDEVEPMGQAEKDRFRRVYVPAEKNVYINYLMKRLNMLKQEYINEKDKEGALEQERKMALAKTVLNNSKFSFDDSASILKARDNAGWNGLSLNIRNFSKLLDASDGTKSDFLDLWNDFCNNLKKPVVERSLENYVDIQDKANDALDFDTESSIFGKAKKSAFDKLSDYIDDLENSR